MILVCNSIINQEEWDNHMARITHAAGGKEKAHIGQAVGSYQSAPDFPGLLISFVDNMTCRRTEDWIVSPLFVSHKQLQRAMGFSNLEELHSAFDVKPIETTPEVSESREV